jgi:two-component system alkaline phosphatase synthesis response regulator PhoP
MRNTTEQHRYVLVVEDDEYIGRILSFLLKRQGYDVELLRDGLAARQLIDSDRPLPVLVLLDVMLPYVNGFDLMATLRAKVAWKSVPVVMLTGGAMERDVVRAFDAGADDYVIKPFQPAELLARVRRFLKEDR